MLEGWEVLDGRAESTLSRISEKQGDNILITQVQLAVSVPKGVCAYAGLPVPHLPGTENVRLFMEGHGASLAVSDG